MVRRNHSTKTKKRKDKINQIKQLTSDRTVYTVFIITFE
jgi:hypothetical protein